jgi:hypothetical protein
MTTKLEKQFFQCFGIKPKYQDTCTVEEKYWDNEELANEYGTFDQYMNAKCGNQENCSLECSCAYQKEIYPQITDKQYLELICVLNENTTLDETYYQGASTVKELKKLVLKDLIKTKENFDTKHQVQAIFEGER